MKKAFLLCSLVVGSAGVASAQTSEADSTNAPRFQFEEEIHDFGVVEEGALSEAVFTFKNVGKQPLIISNVSTACGATIAYWSKEPVIPGKSGIVTVKYNTQGRVGQIDRAAYIQSNAYMPKYKDDRYELKNKGTVVPAEK